MADLRQAAQQAIYALDEAACVLTSPMFESASAALRAALEQPQQEPDAFERGYQEGLNDTIRNGVQWAREYFGAAKQPQQETDVAAATEALIEDACGFDHRAMMRDFLAETKAEQPQQEPVAEVIQFDGEKIIDASMSFFDTHPVGTKLYAAPHQAREWVGITLEDVKSIWLEQPELSDPGRVLFDFARAIEAKLREKNAPQPADPDQVAELEQEARLMRARMERLQAERDELLEAVEGMMDAYSDLCDESEPNYKSFEFRQVRWDRARAAIAKVEGRG